MTNERHAAGASGAAEKKTQAGRPAARQQSDSAGPSAARPSKSRRPDQQPARKPKIGDSRPAPPTPADAGDGGTPAGGSASGGRRRRRRRGGRGSGQKPPSSAVVEAVTYDEPVEIDEKSLKGRRGRTRKGQALGRYLMCVHVSGQITQIAVLEGRRLIEFRVSRLADDVSHIHGNIYLGRVQNVLPGMETAFVDIGTPKNAVLYRGDVQYDPDEIEGGRTEGDQAKPRIEELLRPKQSILCQVTKNPIGEKAPASPRTCHWRAASWS